MIKALHILLVDDEEITHLSLGDYLRDCGHRVESAYDSLMAMQMAAETAFDLALVDVRMPGLDGIGLVLRLRELRPGLPVVVITGHGAMKTQEKALRAGAARFLNKPIDLLTLETTIEEVVHQREELEPRWATPDQGGAR